MMSGYHKLKTACCVAVLTLGLAACGGGPSNADLNAAAAKAKAEAEAAAAEAATLAAAAAELEKQQAVAEAERLAAEQAAAAQAAAEKMARATVQMNTISDAVTAAQTALGMVVLGATDMDIADAGTAVQAAKDAIAAAVDVDDTSMYTATVNGIESSLTTASALVGQDRATKKTARAEMQAGGIMDAITAAETAVALVVEGASNMVISDAEMAVQAAKDAIADAVDVDDTSMYTATVDGLDSSLMTTTDTVLADRLNDRIEMQTGDIMDAIAAAQTAVGMVVLGATDMEIADAETAVQAARNAIEDAVDVDDTSMYTATVNGLDSGLMTASALVGQDRTAKKVARAATQLANIMTAITAAGTAVEMVGIEATDMEIADAKGAVQAVRDAIADAVDVDDTSMHTAQLNGIAGRLETAELAALAYRTLENMRLAGAQQEAIDEAIAAAESAVEMVGPDADADDVANAETKVQDVRDAIAAAADVADTSMDTTTVDGIESELGQRKAILLALMDATAALGALDNDSSDGDIQNVQDKIDAVTTAIGAAGDLSDADKVAFAAKVDDAVGGLKAMLVADKKTIEMARAGETDRANGLAMALDTGKATATTGPETTPSLAETDLLFTATRSASAVMPRLVDSAVTTPDFKKADTVPPAISGWHGSEWTRDTTEMATVYTDIGAPKPLAWTETNIVAVAGGKLPTLTGTSSTTLTVPTGDVTVTDYVNDAIATSLTKAPKGGSIEHRATGTGAAAALTFSGTFGGAMGTYKCSGTSCSVTLDDMGVITTLGYAIMFTPASGARLQQPDGNYLHFGWWVDTPALATGTYEFRTFYGFGGGTTPLPVNKAMVGSATYNGAAAGVYVVKDIEAGRVKGATQGQFTAAARLRANFGADDEAGGSIHGAITGFKDKDGAELSGWRMTLDATSFDSNPVAFASMTTATISGGTENLEGHWRGNFYEAGPATSPNPMAVAGEFDAHGGGAHIAGAFGANR